MTRHHVEPIAVIGMDCLFPGSDGLSAYWTTVREGRDAITSVPQSHWSPADYFDSDPAAPDRTYGRTGGFLPPIDFRPLDFGMPPNAVEATDTSQLLALVVAGRALADAGYAGRSFERTSVILGVTGALELVIPLGARLGHPLWRQAMADAGIDDELAADAVDRISDSYVSWQEASFPGLLGNVVAGRIANRFDLGGTNCVVDAACASSLSAIHLAMLELWSGQRDLVVTGGVDTFNDIFMYMCFSKTPALSPTGHARPFAEDGDGTVLGEGVGILVLKRLSDARRDGDRVHAILRGMGAASDGKGQAVYAPAAAGQARAMRECYAQAGVSPASIDLVEAHGTGTKAGDATELRSLKDVFGGVLTESPRRCAIGSVKSQIGHTKAAAGVAGLIKAVLALQHKVLPPSIKVDTPLAGLRQPDSPFYLNAVKRPWLPSEHRPRRAAVSAFGFGGSNFHCLLEEADPVKAAADYTGEVQIMALSADTGDELGAGLSRLERLSADPAALRRAAGLARPVFRPAAPYRLVLVWADPTEVTGLVSVARRALIEHTAEGLWTSPDQRVMYGRGGHQREKVAVLFPGQGSQYPGMLRDLCCQFPEALETLTAAEQAFGGGLADSIYPVSELDGGGHRSELTRTSRAQPAVGAVSLGAYRVLCSFGLVADAFAGHSYGELTALCAAGRLEPGDFHRLSRLRGTLMEAGEGDRGAMIAVRATEPECTALLERVGLDLVVANRNAPDQCVLAGATATVREAAERFAAEGVHARVLQVSAAFHSTYVAAAATPFAEALRTVEVSSGTAPVYANSTGRCYPDGAAETRAILAGQLSAPVEFQAEIEALYAAGFGCFLELGPGSTLTGLVGRILDGRPHRAIALDRSGGARSGELELAQALAWLAGLGHAIELARWDPAAAELADPADTGSFAIQICGANYANPRRPRPPRQIPRAAAVPASQTELAATPAEPDSAVPKSSATDDVRIPMGADPPNPPSAGGPVSNELQQALRINEEHLRALQRLQQQTAELHKQFLDGQERAFEGMRDLFDQHRRLLESVGGTAGPVATLPSNPTPSPQRPTPQPPPTTPVAEPPQFAEQTAMPSSPAGSVQPSVSVVPAAGPAAGGVGGFVGSQDVAAVLLEVVAEKTGYPADLLDLSMSLDSDLGIDSIKRVEIMSAVAQRVPDAVPVGSEDMARLRTLYDVVALVGAAGAAGSVQPSVSVAPAAGPAPRDETPETSPPDTPQSGDETPDTSPPDTSASDTSASGSGSVKLTAERVAPKRWLPPIDGVRRTGRVAVVGADQPWRDALVAALADRGFEAQARPFGAGGDDIDGLVLLGSSQPDLGEVQDWFAEARSAAAGLRARNGFLWTVARLDGVFGWDGLPAGIQPLSGALAGLAKTAAAEWPEVTVVALDLAAAATPDVAGDVVAGALVDGPPERGFGEEGRWSTANLEPVQLADVDAAVPGVGLGYDDVVIVTGGARGVTAAATLALSRACGHLPHFVLVGRTEPGDADPGWASAAGNSDALRAAALATGHWRSPAEIDGQIRSVLARREIRTTLQALRAAGTRVSYRAVDVRDAAATDHLLRGLADTIGPVTAIVHGAGTLADRLIEDKSDAQFAEVFDTKVVGLANLLDGLGRHGHRDLRFLALFSSLTARFGRRGQADYAMANEVLNKIAGQYARTRAGCRAVALNWGPWQGGMVTDALARIFAAEGIGLIPLDAGADLFTRIAGSTAGPEVVVLAERTVPSAAAATASLAMEFRVDTTSHPFLRSHVLDGRPVLPAAVIIEWLADAGVRAHPGLVLHGVDGVRILKGVVLEPGQSLPLQIWTEPAISDGGVVSVSTELRSEQHGSTAVHARATVVLGPQNLEPPSRVIPDLCDGIALRGSEIYDEQLFHGPDLQSIAEVTGCTPRGISARLSGGAPAPADWIGEPLRGRWLTDPLVIDTVFQLMVVWSLRQSGHPSLPTFVRRYRQYVTRPAGHVAAVHLRVTQASEHQGQADAEMVDEAGRLLATIEGYECVIDGSLHRAFERSELAGER